MKRLLLILSLFFCISCSKDKDEAPSVEFKATIDGDAFNAEVVEGFNNNNTVSITARKNKASTNEFVFYFNLNQVEAGKTYNFASSSPIVLLYKEDYINYGNAIAGTIAVNVVNNKRFEAVFNCTAAEREITNGTIKASIN